MISGLCGVIAATVMALQGISVAGVNNTGSQGGGATSGSQILPNFKPDFDPSVEYQKGSAALQAGKYVEAENHFQDALWSNPKNPALLYVLGLAKVGRGDEKGAAKAFEKSLNADGKQIGARREYGVALAKLGQTDKAQAQLAVLKSRAEACADACPDAADLKAAQAAVQAALSPG